MTLIVNSLKGCFLFSSSHDEFCPISPPDQTAAFEWYSGNQFHIVTNEKETRHFYSNPMEHLTACSHSCGMVNDLFHCPFDFIFPLGKLNCKMKNMKERVSKLTYPTLQHCLRMLYTMNGNSKH